MSRLLALALSLALLAPAAFAAPPEGDKAATPPKDAGADAKERHKVMPRMPKAQELEELVVFGKIQKPEVFYVLGRTDFAYKGLALKKSFVDQIGKSVRSNPF